MADNPFDILTSFISEASNALGHSVKKKKLKYCRATCPDPHCGIMMYFPAHEVSVECNGCGQRHSTVTLLDMKPLEEGEQFQKNLSEMKLIYGGKKTAELVKVKGISNYQCKLLSPLLTTHGKDKNDKPRPLKDMAMGDTFDCSKLASRAFTIEESLLGSKGYGEDKSGSLRYLSDTLERISAHNGGRRGLVPVHADGDGHCLVHAVSRCVVGRELFWHALRHNMKTHLQQQRDQYIALMKDFLSEEEWPEIVAEAAPDYHPPDGQALGLRTVHIYALANILHRPIILLDSIAGLQTKGEYSGIFLPGLYPPDECVTNGLLNSPIVIAWSNAGYNHFIPLVPLKDEPLPTLPPSLHPEVWGMDNALLSKYVVMETDGSIQVGRGKPLQDTYLQKLVTCMEELFYSLHKVTPTLVGDFNQHVYRSAGYVAMLPEMVTMETRAAVEEKRLFRCLICDALSCVPEDWLWERGTLYNIAADEYSLKDGERYTFPRYGVTAEYSEKRRVLVPYEVDCFQCKQTARHVTGDGSVQYQNGDRTTTPADTRFSKCCGYKHYWDGEEYDNIPELYPLKLTWKGQQKVVKIHWFQYESDPSLNSNMYEVASKVVAENYPAEFGDEQLVQQVVEMLLSATEKKSSEPTTDHTHSGLENMDTADPYHLPSSKAIATGMSATGNKVLHKEELGVSDTERQIRRRVEEKLYNRKQQTTPPSNEGKGGRKTSPSPRDTPTTTPPSKVNRVSPATSNSSPKPSPPSPSSLPSNTKRIRVTTSEGKTANLSLTHTDTFSDLQSMIQDQLGVPAQCQRLRWGFPPRELRPSEDNEPLGLAHGERVSVEWVGQGNIPSKPIEDQPSSKHTTTQRSLDFPVGSSSTSSGMSLADQLTSLLSGHNTFQQLQKFPHLFEKGGHCYEELKRSYGNRLVDGMHVQFAEISDINFMYNKREERLEVCLGVEHVPVGPLSREQTELARLAASTSNHGDTKPGESERQESIKWKLDRPGSGSNVKAFSGAGRTLGGGATVGGGATLEGGANDGQALEEELHNLDELIGKAQLIITLKSREDQLSKEVRSINQQLMEIHSSNSQGTPTDTPTELETRLLTLSAELKGVREQLRNIYT